MNAPTLRDWTPSDEPAVEAIWHRVFGAPRGGQTVRWLFRPGPAGLPVRVVAELDGRIVSHAGVMPVRFEVEGEIVRGGWSVGAMTDPAAQGRGIYVRLGEYLYERLEREGFAFVAGFSNRRSHHLMTTALDRTVVGPFPWCVRPIRPGFAALRHGEPPPARAAWEAGSADLRVLPSGPGEAQLDCLWARVAGTARVAAVRDTAFSTWRYGGRPDAGYEGWLARSAAGGTVGALVLRVLRLAGLRFGFVVDLLVDPDVPEAGPALLRAAIHRTREAGGVALSALLPGSGPARSALRDARFVRVPEWLHPQLVRFSVRGLGRYAGRAVLADSSAWWLSWADTDLL